MKILSTILSKKLYDHLKSIIFILVVSSSEVIEKFKFQMSEIQMKFSLQDDLKKFVNYKVV